MPTVLYFSPSISANPSETASAQAVTKVIKEHANIDVNIVPCWVELMQWVQNPELDNLLVIMRLDYLERNDIVIDDVLVMLNTLTRLVANKTVNIALVVNHKIDFDTVATLKRNGVQGIIPGMRFFPKEHSIQAYQTLVAGDQHWPVAGIKTPERFINQKEIKLSEREQEIFNLVTRRGMSNKDIGIRLSLTESTVKGYVSSIMKKYGVRSRTQLALTRETGVIS